MDEEPEDTPIIIFGRNIFKIPCFRNTFLYSISSYIGVGLTTFLFTSKPILSSHVGFAAFSVVTLGYFTTCRLNYYRTEAELNQIRQNLHRRAVMEGSETRKVKRLPELEEV